MQLRLLNSIASTAQSKWEDNGNLLVLFVVTLFVISGVGKIAQVAHLSICTVLEV
jgi:hypothetical protein